MLTGLSNIIDVSVNMTKFMTRDWADMLKDIFMNRQLVTVQTVFCDMTHLRDLILRMTMATDAKL